MNNVFLTGYIAQDPEQRVTPGGKRVCNLSICVKRAYKDASGEYGKDYFRCVLWGSSAEYIEKYAQKGTRIAVNGELHNNVYEKSGVKQYSVEIIVSKVEITESRRDESESANTRYSGKKKAAPYMTGFADIPSESVTDEDLPF